MNLSLFQRKNYFHMGNLRSLRDDKEKIVVIFPSAHFTWDRDQLNHEKVKSNAGPIMGPHHLVHVEDLMEFMVCVGGRLWP